MNKMNKTIFAVLGPVVFFSSCSMGPGGDGSSAGIFNDGIRDAFQAFMLGGAPTALAKHPLAQVSVNEMSEPIAEKDISAYLAQTCGTEPEMKLNIDLVGYIGADLSNVEGDIADLKKKLNTYVSVEGVPDPLSYKEPVKHSINFCIPKDSKAVYGAISDGNFNNTDSFFKLSSKSSVSEDGNKIRLNVYLSRQGITYQRFPTILQKAVTSAGDFLIPRDDTHIHKITLELDKKTPQDFGGTIDMWAKSQNNEDSMVNLYFNDLGGRIKGPIRSNGIKTDDRSLEVHANQPETLEATKENPTASSARSALNVHPLPTRGITPLETKTGITLRLPVPTLKSNAPRDSVQRKVESTKDSVSRASGPVIEKEASKTDKNENLEKVTFTSFDQIHKIPNPSTTPTYLFNKERASLAQIIKTCASNGYSEQRVLQIPAYVTLTPRYNETEAKSKFASILKYKNIFEEKGAKLFGINLDSAREEIFTKLGKIKTNHVAINPIVIYCFDPSWSKGFVYSHLSFHNNYRLPHSLSSISELAQTSAPNSEYIPMTYGQSKVIQTSPTTVSSRLMFQMMLYGVDLQKLFNLNDNCTKTFTNIMKDFDRNEKHPDMVPVQTNFELAFEMKGERENIEVVPMKKITPYETIRYDEKYTSRVIEYDQGKFRGGRPLVVTKPYVDKDGKHVSGPMRQNYYDIKANTYAPIGVDPDRVIGGANLTGDLEYIQLGIYIK